MSLFPPKKKDIAEISLDLEIKGAEMKKKNMSSSPSFRIRLWKVPLSPLGDLLGMTFPTHFNEDCK